MVEVIVVVLVVVRVVIAIYERGFNEDLIPFGWSFDWIRRRLVA